MTVAIAVIGKSGSGKTTFTNSLLAAYSEAHPDRSVLLVDADLSRELGLTFGIEIKNTIFDIRTGKHRYPGKLPEGMTKQEFIEWALDDITQNLYDEIDIIAAGPIYTKDCSCFVANLIKESMAKLVNNYDTVIFDCEYDLEYLRQIVDFPIDVTLIIADTSITSVYSASKIKENSHELAAPSQLGILLNKVKNRKIPENVTTLLSEYDLDILGILPFDEELEGENLPKESRVIIDSTREILFRLNFPR